MSAATVQPVLAAAPRKRAVLLLNIGSPDAPTRSAVGRYLREFLGDGRVIDMPAALRWALVNVVIVPFRSGKSAERYAKIWLEEGSPLIKHSVAQQHGLAARLPGVEVALGMRYGQPAMKPVIDRLLASGVTELVLVPLFPQYASASNGSALERVAEILRTLPYVPELKMLGAFWSRPEWVNAVAAGIERTLAGFPADHLLLSYHGLPLSQLQSATKACGGVCGTAGCCDRLTQQNHACYRAQCFASSAAISARLGRPVTTSFQSRLNGKWIEPFTDEVVVTLAKQGVKKLAVACPSFVSDCLETIEEIGEEAKATFKAAGGEDLRLVPCLNDDPQWLDALARWVSE